LADLRSIIQDSVTTGRIENAVVCGERGFGKTSLLIKIVEECPTGCFSSFRALSSPETPAEFVEATIQKMNLEYKQQLPKHEGLLRSLVENVEEFSVLDIGVAIRRQELTPENGLLQTLLKFRDRKFRSVILFVDEADHLSKEVLALLKNVVEEVRSRYSYPAAVFLAGKDDVTNRLTGQWSPIRRFYIGHIHKLKPFDFAGVKEALTIAGSVLGFTWSDEAAKLVFDESEGHPFVVQLFGDRAEEKCASKEISSDDVKNGYPNVLRDVWDWYKESWTATPSSTESKVLVKVAQLGGRVPYSTLKSASRVRSLGVHLRRLVGKKILLQDDSSGEYYLPTKIVVQGIAKGDFGFT